MSSMTTTLLYSVLYLRAMLTTLLRACVQYPLLNCLDAYNVHYSTAYMPCIQMHTTYATTLLHAFVRALYRVRGK